MYFTTSSVAPDLSLRKLIGPHAASPAALLARPIRPALHPVVERSGRGSTHAGDFSGSGPSTPHVVCGTGFAPPSELRESHTEEPALRRLLRKSQRPLVGLPGVLWPPQPPKQ